MTNLLIVESPTKAKQIAGYLGRDWEVVASVGHIRDLPEKSLGVHPPLFRPTYVILAQAGPVTAQLIRAAKRCKEVYLGSDDDREGEAIAWHLQQVLGLENPKRITYNSITKESILGAIANPRSIDVYRVASQEARRVCDRLVGYLVSPALQKALGGLDYSAGRVQSVALKLVVDLEKDILGHSSNEYYTVQADFGNFVVSWEPEERNFDKALADRAKNCTSFTVKERSNSKSKSQPFAPFITSSLQRAASNSLKLRPKVCMEIAQELYQKGLITYMRTDNPNLSKEMIAAVRIYANKNSLQISGEPRRWNAPVGAQEAHGAITPTDLNVLTAGEDDKQRALYKLIWDRTIACQLADAEFSVQKIEIIGRNQTDEFIFSAKSKQLISAGYKAILAFDSAEHTDKSDDANKSDAIPLPHVEAGANLKPKSIIIKSEKTKAKSRFTEASLIKKLETLRIGRPSSYASVMETITKERDYVKTKPKTQFLVPTDRGIKVCSALDHHFSFMDYNFTQSLESNLDLIQNRKADYRSVVTALNSRLEAELANFQIVIGYKFTCPKCSSALLQLTKKDNKEKKFWSCTSYFDGTCNATYPDLDNKPKMN